MATNHRHDHQRASLLSHGNLLSLIEGAFALHIDAIITLKAAVRNDAQVAQKVVTLATHQLNLGQNSTAHAWERAGHWLKLLEALLVDVSFRLHDAACDAVIGGKLARLLSALAESSGELRSTSCHCESCQRLWDPGATTIKAVVKRALHVRSKWPNLDFWLLQTPQRRHVVLRPPKAPPQPPPASREQPPPIPHYVLPRYELPLCYMTSDALPLPSYDVLCSARALGLATGAGLLSADVYDSSTPTHAPVPEQYQYETHTHKTEL
jgi:hypothetical protein